MFRGFYNLTSGIVCQNRNLNVIGNNMVNISTPGYKSDQFLTSTFQQELLLRTGNKDKSNPTGIGDASMIRAASDVATNFEQGALEPSGGNLDFAINGEGFFVIQAEDGTNVYTRDGAFSVDDQGYLSLSSVGRVMGENGPIQLPSDKISVDAQGRIYQVIESTGGEEDTEAEEEQLTELGKIMIVEFADNNQLLKTEGGSFTSAAQGTAIENPNIMWQYLERSNVDAVEEMTSMMTSQRALQSTSQMLKMYDQLMGRICNDIGKL